VADHPIRLAVGDDVRLSRLTVFFRLILAYPLNYWGALWSLAVFFTAIAQWFYTLAAGRPATPLHAFHARFARFNTHLNAYLFLIANPYPHFVGDPGDYPVDLEVDRSEAQRRWTVALRLILAIPAFVLSYVFVVVVLILAIVGWFIALVLGRLPAGLRNLIAYLLRYELQTLAYVLLLADRYPSLSAPEARETAIERPARHYDAYYV
jgi:hypothetical protein